MRYVEVAWSDAQSVDKWVGCDSLPAPSTVKSRGWIVKETPEYIVLAATVGVDAAGSEEYGEVIAIPKGMFVKMRELGVAYL